MACLDTKFEDCRFSRCRDMKEDPKYKNRCNLGDWGDSRPLAMSPFDIVHTTSYSSFTENMYLSGTIFWRYNELFVESRNFYYSTCVWCPC